MVAELFVETYWMVALKKLNRLIRSRQIKPIFICLICSINCGFCQSIKLSESFLKNNATVITDRLLRVEDFRGTPDLTSPEIAETRSAISTKIISYKEFKDSVHFRFKVFAYFIKSSWIKESAKNYPDTSFLNNIMKHEQDHYDIAILASIEIQRALNKTNFSKKTTQQEYNKIYADLYIKYQTLNRFYETDVDHGRDPGKQNIWNKIISDAMRSQSWDDVTRFMNYSASKK